MQLVERLSAFLKDNSLSVLRFSNESGISAYKVYKWIEGKGNPKHDDVQKIEEWLRNMEVVPHGTSEQETQNGVSRQENPDAMYTTPINTSGKGTRLAMLSEKDQQIAELKEQVKWLKERLTEALQESKELRTMLANSMQKS